MYRKQPVIVPPWGGWNDSAPALTLPQNSFQQITGWIINKQRLTPLPRLNSFDQPSGDIILTARTFRDIQSAYHTVVFGLNAAYYLTAGPVYSQITPSWAPSVQGPYATEVIQSQLFFSNGFDTRYIKGDNAWYPAGDCPSGAQYMGKLTGRLILANLFENQFSFPYRIRYSALNNPLEWDNSIDYTAGEFDLEDVEDIITGMSVINNVVFIFREYGITSMTPTGVGASPFYIENFSAAEPGIGCYFPHTTSTYGTFCVFVAVDDVYLFSGGQPQAIGGNAKKSIFKDLAAASSQVTSVFIGTLNNGVDFVSYWLMIPQNSDTTTSVWVYHLDSQTWVNQQFPFGALRSLSNIGVA